jgi:hypothetical protein
MMTGKKNSSMTGINVGGFSELPSTLKTIFEADRQMRNLLSPPFSEELARVGSLGKQGAVFEAIRRANELSSSYSKSLENINNSFSGAFALQRQMQKLFPLTLGEEFGRTMGLSKYGAISEAMKESSRLESPFSKQMEEVHKSLSHLGRDVQKEFGLVRMPELGLASIAMQNAVSRQVDRISGAFRESLLKPGFLATVELAHSGRIATGLASEILDHYDVQPGKRGRLFEQTVELTRFSDSESSITDSDAVQQLLSEILQKLLYLVEKLDKKDAIGLVGWVTIIGFVFAIYGFYDQNKDMAQLIDLQKREVEIQEKADKAREDEKNFIKYVIGKTPLRSEAHKGSLLIRYVFPDQLIRVIDANGNWLFVEVYEYSSDQPIRGWMYRGNVRASQ